MCALQEFSKKNGLEENFIHGRLTFLVCLAKIKTVPSGGFHRFEQNEKFEEDIMKKLFAVLLAVVMVVGLCACSVSEKPAETTANLVAAR